MSNRHKDDPESGDRPSTEFVRLPTRPSGPAPVKPSATPQAEPWRPPAQRPPDGQAHGYEAPTGGGPFGGFESRPTTSMVRLRESKSRMLGVVAVLVGIFVLGAAAFVLARPDLFGLGDRPGPKPTPEVVTPVGTHDGPREAPPAPEDTGTPTDATEEAAAPAKTGSKAAPAAKSGTTTKSGSTTKKTLSGGK